MKLKTMQRIRIAICTIGVVAFIVLEY